MLDMRVFSILLAFTVLLLVMVIVIQQIQINALARNFEANKQQLEQLETIYKYHYE